VFGGLAVVGLVCLRRTWSTKLVVLALVITAIVLAGVFAPTFIFQILDPKLVAAIALILILWLVAAVLSRRPTPVNPPPPPSPTTTANGTATDVSRPSPLVGEPLDPNKTVDAESQSPFQDDAPKPGDGSDQGGRSHD
jgi:hypothetical protein